jgi:hypothetical protein
MNRTLKAQHFRGRIDKWGYMKLKRFCTAKVTVIRLKRKPTEWKKTLASYTSDKGFITKIYMELKKLT